MENYQNYPACAIDREGNIWVTWVDHRFSDQQRQGSDIFIQKISSESDENGNPEILFDELDGIPVCSADNDQLYPQLVHDSHNGMWVVWEDYRGFPWSDIYATHLNIDGEPFEGWDENGIMVAGAIHKQEQPKAALLRDSGETGIAVVWTDKRASGYGELFNIYAQRVDDDMVHIKPAEKAQQPSGYSIGEAFPNPFNSQTMITYSVPVRSELVIGLYDVTGRLVRRLFAGNVPQGEHLLPLNAELLPAGSYIIRLKADNIDIEREITVVK